MTLVIQQIWLTCSRIKVDAHIGALFYALLVDDILTDVILQGKQVALSDVLELRNAANDAKDLRQPLNLQEQVRWP